MKITFTLILVSLLYFSAAGQNIQKQLDELDTAYAHGDYELAKKLADKIYPHAKQITNDTALVEFLSTCGSLHYQLGDYAKAASFFSEAAEKAKTSLGETEYHYSLALFNLASCYKEEGRYTEAEPLYIKSLPVLAEAFGQSSLEYTRCFYTLGSMYVDMGRYTEAESMCAAAVHFYKSILGQTSPDYLGALGTMGVIYQGQGKYDKAEEIFLALKNHHASQPSPDKAILQTLENNLGELYRHMGDYEKAEAALQHAVTMAGDSPSAAVSFNNLGLVQKAAGNYAEAEASYKKALRTYIATGRNNHPDYTNPLNNLGELYRTMGRLQEAVYAFEEAMELRKKTLGTAHPNYANVLNNLALVEFAIGNYGDAEKHLQECREIYQQILGEGHRFYANSLNNLASVLKAQGKLQQAEEMYKECLRIYKATYGEASDKYAVYLGGLAGTYRLMKRYDDAIALTLQSLGILKNKLGENHYDHIETEYNLAETYREAGKNIEAEKHYLNAMKGYLLLIEKYFPYLGEQEKTSFYYNVANAFETFNSFVIQLHRQNTSVSHTALITRMYNNQVALKSLLLKESGKMREAVALTTDEKIKNDYRHWLSLRETIVQHYRLSAEDRDAKGINLVQLEVNANNLEQQVVIALGLENNSAASRPLAWTDIQAVLQPGEYAVEMVRTDYYENGRWTDTVCYTALIIDRNSKAPEFVLLFNGHQLETQYISAYRIAMKGRRDDLASYDRFWKPLQQSLPGATKIYFSADGVYQQLNLYTLKNPATGQYLIDEANIHLLTNTKDILRQPNHTASKKAAIFSFPDFGAPPQTMEAPMRWTGFPNLDELPGTKTEADSVRRILTARQWMVQEHLRKEASEEGLKKISHPQVLHIATHGFFLNDVKDSTGNVFGIRSDIAKQNPMLRSGLVMAGAAAVAKNPEQFTGMDDGILTAYEAAGLQLTGTSLVVLSACETGLGEIRNGQGVYGLQRSFLLAGARSVIMSLWKVDDKATMELMIRFYSGWLNDAGGNKQEALRNAQLKLREKFSHPFFWGAFVMVGE